MELANCISNVLHLEIIMKDQFYEAVQLAFNLFYSMYSFTLRIPRTEYCVSSFTVRLGWIAKKGHYLKGSFPVSPLQISENTKHLLDRDGSFNYVKRENRPAACGNIETYWLIGRNSVTVARCTDPTLIHCDNTLFQPHKFTYSL